MMRSEMRNCHATASPYLNKQAGRWNNLVQKLKFLWMN